MTEFAHIDPRNNMGTVRYVLAAIVVLLHFDILMGVDFAPFAHNWAYLCVDGFFTLSGFLIYGSYGRSGNTVAFFKKRARKILPPYLFIILLATFTFWLTVTPIDPAAYFSSSQTWQYLVSNCCFLNFLQPALPGVFAGGVMTAVDGSLWSLKIECLLYVSVPVMFWVLKSLRLRSNRRAIATICVVAALAYCILGEYGYSTGNKWIALLAHQIIGPVVYFYVGVLLYLCYEWFMRRRWPIIAVALALWSVGEWIPNFYYLGLPFVISTVVVWLSMVGKWGTWSGINDNITYEIYIFHWPIIQLVHQYGPSLGLDIWLSLAVVIVATVGLSLACWFGFDKRIIMANRRLHPRAL